MSSEDNQPDSTDLWQQLSWIHLSLLSLSICLLGKFYQARKMKLYYNSQSKVWNDLSQKSKLFDLIYTPWTFGFNSFLQTLFFAFIEVCFQYYYRFKPDREIFELSDGGIVGLDWFYHNKTDGSKKPILAVLPGLTGDHTQIYNITTIKEGLAAGFDVVVINYRGLAGVPLKTPKLYHGGDCNDAKEVFNYLHTEHCVKNGENGEKKKLFAIGLSLGAGLLGKYLAQEKENAKIDAGFGLCCAFSITKAFAFMQQNMFGIFDVFLGQCCKNRNRGSFLQYDELVSKTHPEKIVSPELEKVVNVTIDYSSLIAKTAGYKNVQEYYEDCDVIENLHQIRKPMFFLSAIDDPFFGPNCLPFEQFSAPYAMLGVTKTGGHVSYFNGKVIPSQWFMEPAVEFFKYFMRPDSVSTN